MSTTLFIALQCSQCSTMQVKQQRKSSNKWVCVICNQKQSVRKVFAQGYKAKELRFFVQSFNLSRKSLEEEEEEEEEEDTAAACRLSEIHVDGEVEKETPADWRKRRTDWSEFIDLDSPHHFRRSPELVEGQDGIDPKIVTEMPKDMFKKPRLNKYSRGGGSSSDTSTQQVNGNELYKPIFSRRSINKQDQCSEKASKRQNDLKQRNLVPGGASKWNAYLTQEKDEDRALPQLGQRDALEDVDVREWSRAVLEISMADQTVDDEIHPDFT